MHSYPVVDFYCFSLPSFICNFLGIQRTCHFSEIICMILIFESLLSGPEFSAPSSVNSSTSTLALLGAGTGTTQGIDEILKVLSPPLVAFITQLPAVKGTHDS